MKARLEIFVECNVVIQRFLALCDFWGWEKVALAKYLAYAIFITVIFQNFPKIFGLCVFIPTWLMRFWGNFLPNAILFAIYLAIWQP